MQASAVGQFFLADVLSVSMAADFARKSLKVFKSLFGAIFSCHANLTDALHEFAGRNAEGVRQLKNRRHTDVEIAAFNSTNIVLMEAGKFGQLLLSQSPRLSQATDGHSQSHQVAMFAHTATVASSTVPSYTGCIGLRPRAVE